MKAFLTELVVACVAVLLVLALVFHLGRRTERDVWLAEKAKAEAQARTDYEAEVKRGQAAAADSLVFQRNLELKYADLQTRFDSVRQSVPLALPRPGNCAVAVAATGARAGTDTTATTQGRIELPADDAGAVPGLTLAAVWVWNSTLAGENVPAGACGADAATSQPDAACAEAAGLDIEDAWRNHAVNAQSCAADRARHQRLIDFLTEREANR